MAVAGANGPSSGGVQGSVWIGLLGPLEVRRDGTEVSLPRGASRRLLTLLAQEAGRPIRDETLIDRIWGEDPPASVVYSLRNVVTRIRAILGGGVVERTVDGYRLNLSLVSTDLREFSTLVELAGLRARDDLEAAVVCLDRALSLVRGVPFSDGPDDLETLTAVGRVEEQVRAAEEQWGAFRLALEHLGGDLVRFREAAEREPLREVRWTQLIDAMVLAGRRAEALRVAQRAKDVLKEVGLSPSAELEAAEQRALGVSVRAVRWTPGATQLESRRVFPLVGRKAQLEQLDPLPSLSRVCGVEGAGKTRFLAEISARERERGLTVIYVTARARNVGDHFFVEVARELRAADPAETALTPAMQALLSGAEGEWLAVHPIVEVRDARVRSAAEELLTRVLARGEVLLLLDDAHLLDVDAARGLIELLERPRRGLRVVFSVTTQNNGVPSVLDRIGRELVVDSSVDLDPLNPAEVESLMTSAGGAAVPRGVLQDVIGLSGGNPSLVLEAMRHIVRAGVAATTGTHLEDIVLQDLRRRGPVERELLAVLALLGRPAGLELLASAIERAPSDALEGLESLVAARLVDRVAADGFSIRLALVAQAVPDSMPNGSMIRLRHRLIGQLRGRPDHQQLLVEQLFEVFDGSADAASELSEVLLLVLRSCIERVDYGTALRLGDRYLEVVGLQSYEHEAVEAQLLTATAMLACGEVSKGKALLDLVAERAAHVGSSTLHADALLALGPVQTGSEHAARIADEAERVLGELAPDDTIRRIRLATWSAHHRINQGRRAEALHLVASVSAEASSSSLPTWRALVLLTSVHAELTIDGSPSAARSRVQELRAWAALTRDETAEASAALGELATGLLSGSIQDVELARDAVGRASERLPRSDLRWIPSAVDAGLAVALGDLGVAARLIDEAEAVGRRLNAAGSAPLAMLQRALCARLDGSYGRLAPLLEPSSDPALRRHDLVALWGLACLDSGDSEGVRRAASLLGERKSLLNRVGPSWPVVAMAVAEVAWAAGDAVLANRLWDELRHWSGSGLSVLGMAYAGAADTWLGLATAAMGRTKTAAALLSSAVQQEADRGLEPFRARAQNLLEAVRSTGESGGI